MHTLDVGCGDKPKGDVNIDLFFYGKWNNFVIAEAHCLPFKNNTKVIFSGDGERIRVKGNKE